jgi:FkbH-like protein
MSQTDLSRALNYPFDLEVLFQKKKALRRLLSEKPGPFLDKRIAILGGSTTAEIRDMLELFLLKEGIRPTFYESEYNRYLEDVMFDNPALASFHPEMIYVHTSYRNLKHHPAMTDSPEEVNAKVEAEMTQLRSFWRKIQSAFGALILQNNVELPPVRLLGNLDFSDHRGEVHFVHAINARLAAEAAASEGRVLIHDLHYLAACYGLDRWHDLPKWYAYKYALAYDAIPLLAHQLSRMILAACGKSRKGVIVDLDNTLWGGVVGDDGVDRLQIGQETAVAEAYAGFQAYLKDLRSRGIVLGVASKNDPAAAQSGLGHPENVLKPEDFASIQAGWDPKDRSITKIAQETNLGIDSFVFVDDNPAERDWVAAQLPGLAVPDTGADVTRFARILDREGYFEPIRLSDEDLARGRFYSENHKREQAAQGFADYGAFLSSLEMHAEIAPFSPLYLDRITQLIHKTNQFNLTTRRYTAPEVEALSRDPRTITLYGKLKDRYGDNGLVTALIARQDEDAAQVELWIMSCRVLQRRMEQALFSVLLEECRRRRISRLLGTYLPTPKNGLVRDLYETLGFKLRERQQDGGTLWEFTVPSSVSAGPELPMTIDPAPSGAKKGGNAP